MEGSLESVARSRRAKDHANYVVGDGSKEWTPEWLEKLGHRFGDDGDFWIAYEDLLRKYQAFERTRLFGEEWSVTQIWTTLNVPWMVNYHDTYFSLSISKPGPVVLVLSQLDDRARNALIDLPLGTMIYVWPDTDLQELPLHDRQAEPVPATIIR